jgi:predicted nucleic acid-binding protein
VIVLDTSAVLALANRSDDHHGEATRALEADTGPYLLPAGIFAETGYMLEHRCAAGTLDAFLADLEAGALAYDCGEDDFGRIRELVARYADVPLGVADAAVLACAERTGAPILTFDRHFAVVAREGTVKLLTDARS